MVKFSSKKKQNESISHSNIDTSNSSGESVALITSEPNKQTTASDETSIAEVQLINEEDKNEDGKEPKILHPGNVAEDGNQEAEQTYPADQPGEFEENCSYLENDQTELNAPVITLTYEIVQESEQAYPINQPDLIATFITESSEEVIHQGDEQIYPVEQSENQTELIASVILDSDEVESSSSLDVISSVSDASTVDNVVDDLSKEECSFFRAIKANNIVKLKKLISAERDQGALCNGKNAFHYAVEKLNIDAVKVLIKSKLFDVNEPSRIYNSSPLHIVAIKSCIDPEKALNIAKILINNRANINARDEFGYSPLFHAVANLNKKFVNLLIRSGADIGIKSYTTNANIFHYIMSIDHPESQSRFRPTLQTLINAAVKQDKLFLLKEFNNFNLSPIHEAAAKNCAEGLKEILANNFFDVNTKSQLRGEINFSVSTLYGATPLHFAAHSGSVEVLKLLLSHNGVENRKDEDGKFPYEYSNDELVTEAFNEKMETK